MKKTLLLATALCASAGFANAAILAQWNGVANAAGLDSNLNITKEDTFTTTSFQSPPEVAPYDVLSPDFYAATNAPNSDGWNLFNGGGNDLLGRYQDFGADFTGEFTSMIVWEIASGNTLTDFSLTGLGTFGSASNGEARALVQLSDDSWYVSTAYSGGAITVTAASDTWFAYTPHNAGVSSISGTGVSGATLDFDNVKLAGYYQEADIAGGGGIFSTSLTINGTAIPEPSSAALLGLGLLGLLTRRKRT